MIKESYQLAQEFKYSKSRIMGLILKDMRSSPQISNLIDSGIELIENWMEQDYFPSKNARIDELKNKDIKRIVENLMCVIAQYPLPAKFTEVVGECTGMLRFSNKIDGTKTAAELLAVLSDTGLFTLSKESKYAELYLQCNFDLDTTVVNTIMETKYLPPLAVPPRVVKKNYDYSYLTERSSMILGKGTHHDGNICLDSINKFNQVPLCLNEKLLKTLSEKPKKEYNPDVQAQWYKFTTDSYSVFRDIIQTGNEFWLTHKVDKRGRTYAQGYHVTTQGNQFRKAICEFAEKEVIEL